MARSPLFPRLDLRPEFGPERVGFSAERALFLGIPKCGEGKSRTPKSKLYIPEHQVQPVRPCRLFCRAFQYLFFFLITAIRVIHSRQRRRRIVGRPKFDRGQEFTLGILWIAQGSKRNALYIMQERVVCKDTLRIPERLKSLGASIQHHENRSLIQKISKFAGIGLRGGRAFEAHCLAIDLQTLYKVFCFRSHT